MSLTGLGLGSPAWSDVHSALLRVQAGLAALALTEDARRDAAGEVAARLSERIRRDVLPRLGAGQPVLVVAIAGPNNVGKSTLFNALVGRVISPAHAEGGLTKQCLAVGHPSLAAGALRDFLDRRFAVVPVDPGEVPRVTEPGPPGRLFLALEPELPPGVLLMDTPDFDSVFTGNRLATEALLVTADVLVFVVSRHTYQNLALVEFLRLGVGRGRPYVLVYNEAPSLELARAHLSTLARDVGAPGLARFAAEHQPRVGEGVELLRLTRLEPGAALRELLFEPASRAALKARALAASLRDTRAELEALEGVVEERAREPARLAERVRHELRQAGCRAALLGVPADVLVEAFRDELDARSTVHRLLRRPFRMLATALTFVGRRMGRTLIDAPAEAASAPAAPARGVEASLRDGLRAVVEALSSELGAWRGSEAIGRALQDATSDAALARLDAPLGFPELADAPLDRAALYRFCRALLAAELRGGPGEELLQLVATLLYSVPTGAAAFVTLGTGGVGHDVVIWGGTLLSTPLLQKFIDALGRDLRARVSQRWAEAHGETLAQAAARELFPALLKALDEEVAGCRGMTESLRAAVQALDEVGAASDTETETETETEGRHGSIPLR